MNTISYKDLKQWYTQNDHAKETAKIYFGDTQPSFYQTGFYSAPSWNWGYQMGIVTVQTTMDGEPIEKTFDIVTQFGSVVAAREIVIPKVTA